MKNIIKRIKDFFKRLFGINETKLLEQANVSEKEIETINDNRLIKEKNETDKNDVLDIYKKIKKGEYDPDFLDDQKREKVNTLIKNEIEIKKRHLEEKTAELKTLRQENMPNEKQRIIDLYYQVKDDNVNLDSINYEDLIKIRRLLLEETKMRDELIEEDIALLEIESIVGAETATES